MWDPQKQVLRGRAHVQVDGITEMLLGEPSKEVGEVA